MQKRNRKIHVSQPLKLLSLFFTMFRRKQSNHIYLNQYRLKSKNIVWQVKERYDTWPDHWLALFTQSLSNDWKLELSGRATDHDAPSRSGYHVAVPFLNLLRYIHSTLLYNILTFYVA